jgi:hypothetical protein
MLETDSAIDLQLLSLANIAFLHPLLHQANHLFSAGKPRVAEGKVYRVHKTVIEKPFRNRQTVMKKALICLNKLRLICLIVEAF